MKQEKKDELDEGTGGGGGQKENRNEQHIIKHTSMIIREANDHPRSIE